MTFLKKSGAFKEESYQKACGQAYPLLINKKTPITNEN
ncbi:hypothetical protein BWR56_0549 [Streptococcus oralis]|nr:hypothetical protein BWR56_0549 [Streptococcus oralis]